MLRLKRVPEPRKGKRILDYNPRHGDTFVSVDIPFVVIVIAYAGTLFGLGLDAANTDRVQTLVDLRLMKDDYLPVNLNVYAENE